MFMGGTLMPHIDRRSALALGLGAAAATPIFAPTSASAQTYGPTEGKEIAPGVRRIDLSKRDSMVPAYKTVSMRDMVYQPGASSNNPSMASDMVCHCLEGELHVSQGPGKEFIAKKGTVWSCMKGQPEGNKNTGNVVAIMRVIDLIP
jgi:quercetin dioxygenase-like cupin family protein